MRVLPLPPPLLPAAARAACAARPLTRRAWCVQAPASPAAAIAAGDVAGAANAAAPLLGMHPLTAATARFRAAFAAAEHEEAAADAAAFAHVRAPARSAARHASPDAQSPALRSARRTLPHPAR